MPRGTTSSTLGGTGVPPEHFLFLHFLGFFCCFLFFAFWCARTSSAQCACTEKAQKKGKSKLGALRLRIRAKGKMTVPKALHDHACAADGLTMTMTC